MRTENDVLEVTQMMAADLGCTMADVAAAVDRQQSALCRQLSNNPTWRTLMDVAWALGLGINPETGEGRVAVQWLLISKHDYKHYRGTHFVLNHSCQVLKQKAVRANKKLTRHATWGRGPDYDPTDKGHLSEVYPGKALEGADGAPIDSRFIEAPQPEPLHGKTTQGPGGATRVASMQDLGRAMQGHDTRTDAEAIADTLKTNNMAAETFEQRQARLSEGAPQGYRLSAKALADAPRTPYAMWQKAGWDIDKLIHHGYLEVDPANPPTYELPPEQQDLNDLHDAYKQSRDAGTNNPTEQRRVEASKGAPDGWILSDRAMEIEGVTFDKLVEAMGLEKMKADRFLVPKAWLGHA